MLALGVRALFGTRKEKEAHARSSPPGKEAGGNNYFLEKESLHAKFNYSERSPISQTSEFYVVV